MTGADAKDGVQAGTVLNALVVRPPTARDERARPTVHADGAYQNRPTRDWVARAGVRLRPTRRGQKTGVGKVRQAVERCHNFFVQFGRIRVRLDRTTKRFLGWVQMAACAIFIRSGLVR